MKPIITWLLTEGRLCTTVPELLLKFGEVLKTETGCSRIWLGTKVLHPQAIGHAWFWEDGEINRITFSYERAAKLEQEDSPGIRFANGIDEIQLTAPNDDGMHDVAALYDRGFTGFFAKSIHFQGIYAGGITYSSKAPFTDEHLELLRELNPVLSAIIEPLTYKLVTANLLETYLGKDAGQKVFLGQVKRGDGQTLRAVVWFSDIRGFTSMSERLELGELLEVLNDAFELVVNAVEENGGEVLKFMGDGLLAVFPCDEGDAQACALARNAALQLVENMSTVKIGVGLHLGEVNYGNIGAPGRLDFTVIGPDVNLAARVEGQTSSLGQHILATSSVTEHGQWEEVAEVSLKGVAEPVQLYTPRS